MSPQNLAPGFITMDEAVALIKSDNRKDPVIDMDYIVSRTKWIETGQNFRIPKIARLATPYRDRRGHIVEFEKKGSVYVAISTNFEKELLKKTIFDKFRELTGKEYKERITRGMSTVADDAEGVNAVKPRARKSSAKEGDSIANGGAIIDTNGDGLAV